MFGRTGKEGWVLGNVGEDIGLVPWDLDNSDLNQIEDEFSIVLNSQLVLRFCSIKPGS